MNPPERMFPPRPTALAHSILRERIAKGDHVIDATAGNGHDTVFLAECVGASGLVHGFDVQESALFATRERVRVAGMEERVVLHHVSHAMMKEFCEAASVSVVMFNLGYLPGDDHSITTHGDETLHALAAACLLLKSGGVLSVVCYPGHAEGADEATVVEAWMKEQAAQGWRVSRYGMVGTLRPAPCLFIAGKP